MGLLAGDADFIGSWGKVYPIADSWGILKVLLWLILSIFRGILKDGADERT